MKQLKAKYYGLIVKTATNAMKEILIYIKKFCKSDINQFGYQGWNISLYSSMC